MDYDEIKELKAGDKIQDLKFGKDLYNGKVIKNFPKQEKVQIRIGGWIFGTKWLFRYDSGLLSDRDKFKLASRC